MAGPAQAQPIEVRGFGVTGPGPAGPSSLANPQVLLPQFDPVLPRSARPGTVALNLHPHCCSPQDLGTIKARSFACCSSLHLADLLQGPITNYFNWMYPDQQLVVNGLPDQGLITKISKASCESLA